jgi:hypothetical protein
MANPECMLAELDIFEPPLVQTSVLNSDWINFLPVHAVTKGSPITFLVPSQGSAYIDLTKTLLYVRMKVKNATTGAALGKDAKVSLVNYPLAALFSNISIDFNGVNVASSNNMAHYRSYFETLINYNSSAKDSHLTSALFIQDTPGRFNDLTSEPNKQRAAFIQESKELELFGKMHSDILNINKYMLNGIDIKITLTRNSDALVTLSEDTLKAEVEILESILYIRKIDVSPSILVAHAKILEGAVAKYPYKRVEMVNYTLSSGIFSKSIDNLCHNRIPDRIIFGLTTNSSFSGNVTESPFNFEHFDCNNVALSVNGGLIGGSPFKPNYAESKHIRPFLFSFFGNSLYLSDDGWCVGRQDYPSGFCLYSYDTSVDMGASESYMGVQRQGSLRLDLGFAKALTSVVNLIVLFEVSDVLEIDRNRNVLIQYKN